VQSGNETALQIAVLAVSVLVVMFNNM
jgi:hypothetical protein